MPSTILALALATSCANRRDRFCHAPTRRLSLRAGSRGCSGRFSGFRGPCAAWARHPRAMPQRAALLPHFPCLLTAQPPCCRPPQAYGVANEHSNGACGLCSRPDPAACKMGASVSSGLLLCLSDSASPLCLQAMNPRTGKICKVRRPVQRAGKERARAAASGACVGWRL